MKYPAGLNVRVKKAALGACGAEGCIGVVLPADAATSHGRTFSEDVNCVKVYIPQRAQWAGAWALGPEEDVTLEPLETHQSSWGLE